jgi:PAS domain S-box-containing protein
VLSATQVTEDQERPSLAYVGLFQAALDASDDHVLITDRKGLIVFANAALARSHEASRELLIGRPATLIMPSELNIEQLEKIRQAYRDGQLLRISVQGRRSDGGVMWVSMAIRPIFGADGRANHFISIGTDITREVEDARIKEELQSRIETQEQERQRMAMELRVAQKLEAVGRLASGVAHEINTPMQYIADNVTFLNASIVDVAGVIVAYRRDASQGQEAARSVDVDFLLEEMPKALLRAQDGIDRVTEIVRAMKEFSHPGSASQSSADLHHALENTLAMSRSEYKHVAVIEKQFGALPLVPCKIGELNQVFLNLIVNAAHAIERAAKDCSSGCIRITTEHCGEDVAVAIEDNGCGIPQEHMDKIFDPFFTTKDVGEGTGQGLAIARSIVVDRHGGAIDVHSEVGVGTRITIRLPIAGRNSDDSVAGDTP